MIWHRLFNASMVIRCLLLGLGFLLGACSNNPEVAVEPPPLQSKAFVNSLERHIDLQQNTLQLLSELLPAIQHPAASSPVQLEFMSDEYRLMADNSDRIAASLDDLARLQNPSADKVWETLWRQLQDAQEQWVNLLQPLHERLLGLKNIEPEKMNDRHWQELVPAVKVLQQDLYRNQQQLQNYLMVLRQG